MIRKHHERVRCSCWFHSAWPLETTACSLQTLLHSRTALGQLQQVEEDKVFGPLRAQKCPVGRAVAVQVDVAGERVTLAQRIFLFLLRGQPKKLVPRRPLACLKAAFPSFAERVFPLARMPSRTAW